MGLKMGVVVRKVVKGGLADVALNGKWWKLKCAGEIRSMRVTLAMA